MSIEKAVIPLLLKGKYKLKFYLI